MSDHDCPACDLHHSQIAAMRLGGGRCDNTGCPMFTAQQISPECDERGAAWGLIRAIALIERRRATYIRENCKSIGNGGDWEGTVAQEEYVSELDDIIALLRKEQEGASQTLPEARSADTPSPSDAREEALREALAEALDYVEDAIKQWPPGSEENQVADAIRDRILSLLHPDGV